MPIMLADGPPGMTTDDRLEIRRFGPALRAFTVSVWGVAGAFFVVLALLHSSRGHELGFALGGACIWTALYWLLVPAVMATVGDDGFSYVDVRFGALLWFPTCHAAWADIVAVDTREVPTHTGAGSYVRTRLTLRAGEGAHHRRLAISSRDQGYSRFIDMLAAHTAGLPIEMHGLGVESIGVRQALHRIRDARLGVIGAMALLGVVLLLFECATRR